MFFIKLGVMKKEQKIVKSNQCKFAQDKTQDTYFLLLYFYEHRTSEFLW